MKDYQIDIAHQTGDAASLETNLTIKGLEKLTDQQAWNIIQTVAGLSSMAIHIAMQFEHAA